MLQGFGIRPGRSHALGTLGLAVIMAVAAGCGSSSTPESAAPPKIVAPPPVAAVNVTAPGGDQVNPKTPIVVNVQRGKLTSVVVTNPSGKHVSGAMSGDQTSWQTNEVLGYDTDYQVTAVAVGSDGKTVQQQKTIHTLAPAAQVFPSMIPAPQPGLSLGAGEPIVVKFQQPIKDKAAAERNLQVTSTPNQTGSWSWISNKELHYRPRTYWEPGSKVTVKATVYGVNLGNGVYGEADQTLEFTVHDSWVAKADGATEQMQIFHNGQMVKAMPISMGKDQTPTHVGPHVISDKQPKFTMDSCTYGVCPPDPQAYHSDEFFAERISNDGEFVHENPASVAQQGSANVSHGCINLDHDNAQWFFDNFGLGDVVEIYNSNGPPLPVWDTYGDWEVPWNQWVAGSALH